MTSDTIELVERVRRHLREHDNPCQIMGPVSESQISAAEEALGVTFPPSYRTFLRTFGGITIPPHLGIVHDFVGVANEGAGGVSAWGVVARTLEARAERRLADHLVVVGMGAQYQEWFCLATTRLTSSSDSPQ